MNNAPAGPCSKDSSTLSAAQLKYHTVSYAGKAGVVTARDACGGCCGSMVVVSARSSQATPRRQSSGQSMAGCMCSGLGAFPSNQCHYRVTSGASCVHIGTFFFLERDRLQRTAIFIWKSLGSRWLGQTVCALAFPKAPSHGSSHVATSLCQDPQVTAGRQQWLRRAWCWLKHSE